MRFIKKHNFPGGVYTGNFAMPGQASTLVINTGTSGNNSSPDGLDKD